MIRDFPSEGERVFEELKPLGKWAYKLGIFNLRKDTIVEDFNRIVARDGCFSQFGMDELRFKHQLPEKVIWEFLVKLNLVNKNNKGTSTNEKEV